MFKIFREELGITIAIFGLMGFSLTIRILLGILYGHLIRETDNMAVTKSRILKQCKLRFMNCYQMNNGVNNIPVFVDRFLSRMSLGAFTYERLYHFSGQTMLLSVLACGIGICKCIVEGHMLGEILPFYILCFAGLYLYCSVSSAVDIKGKRRLLKVNLVDYLENHLSTRIGVTNKDLEMLYQGKVPKRGVEIMPIQGRGVQGASEGETPGPDSREVAQGQAPAPGGSNIAGSQGRPPMPEDDSPVTEEELEALLKDFLAI